jgi:hypothetical protein
MKPVAAVLVRVALAVLMLDLTGLMPIRDAAFAAIASASWRALPRSAGETATASILNPLKVLHPCKQS